MSDRLLRKSDIAAMLGTSPAVAMSILRKRGCNPIDFGHGRGRGLRWLESAVTSTLQAMHRDAQNQKNKAIKAPSKKITTLNLVNMKADALHTLLTRSEPIQ